MIEGRILLYGECIIVFNAGGEDIDYINQKEEWVLLDYISDSSFIKLLDKFDSGTLVLWENLDRIVGNAQKNNESVKNPFYQEMSIVSSSVIRNIKEYPNSEIFLKPVKNYIQTKPDHPKYISIKDLIIEIKQCNYKI